MGMSGPQETQFYDLCLHPTAELIETNAADIPPRGSLLVWIDDFLEEPATPLDRTLGRWENLVQVPYVIPPKLRGRFSIKAFSLLRHGTSCLEGGDPQPQQHGDFSQAPYWDPLFWQPAHPCEADQKHIKSAALERETQINQNRPAAAK